jgi:hypothetical protein
VGAGGVTVDDVGMVDVVDLIDEVDVVDLIDVDDVELIVPLPIQTARVTFAARFAYSPVSQFDPTHGFQAASCVAVILVSEARSEHR